MQLSFDASLSRAATSDNVVAETANLPGVKYKLYINIWGILFMQVIN